MRLEAAGAGEAPSGGDERGDAQVRRGVCDAAGDAPPWAEACAAGTPRGARGGRLPQEKDRPPAPRSRSPPCRSCLGQRAPAGDPELPDWRARPACSRSAEASARSPVGGGPADGSPSGHWRLSCFGSGLGRLGGSVQAASEPAGWVEKWGAALEGLSLEWWPFSYDLCFILDLSCL